MVGDACPQGHFVVGKLDAIDGPLREQVFSLSDSATMRFLGIVPFVHVNYPSVRLGSSVFFSVSIESNGTTTTVARIIDFAVNLSRSLLSLLSIFSLLLACIHLTYL